ncbi:MAG: hypothetical protein JWQ48_1351 [Conexibacter sp.]|jgi:hypothetical protein|nr:hypothetical protein [Conexibacter sp.]
MSAQAVAVTPIDELVARYRGMKLSRGQLITALVAAGATTAGAVALTQAVDHSQATPQPIVSQGGHQQLTGVAATDQVAAHQRHIGLQGAGR